MIALPLDQRINVRAYRAARHEHQLAAQFRAPSRERLWREVQQLAFRCCELTFRYSLGGTQPCKRCAGCLAVAAPVLSNYAALAIDTRRALVAA